MRLINNPRVPLPFQLGLLLALLFQVVEILQKQQSGRLLV
jgi:hypothetical protein